jgi:phosphoesterase RecJ-like protein
MEQYVPQSLLQTLREHSRFILIGHEDPDGDCLSSQYALASYLRRRGGQTALVTPGSFERPEIEPFREHFALHLPEDFPEEDCLVIVMDCSTLDRIGYLAEEIGERQVAVVDHHSAGRPFGEVHFIDPRAPSVTYMVLHLIEAFGDVPTEEEAKSLLFGLATDTGYFRHVESGSAETFRAVARLVSAGADPKAVHQLMYGGRSLESKLLLGRLLSRAELRLGGRAVFTYETLEDARRFGKQHRDSDALYSHLQGIRDNELAVLIREEEPGRCTVGLRSHGKVDVGELARHFGGGGHVRAAGFTWSGSRQEAEQSLLRELEGTI